MKNPYSHYPRVTTILDKTKDKEAESRILKWKKKMESIHGIEGAKIERQKILDNGTALHLSIEKFLGDETQENPHPWVSNVLPFLQIIKKDSQQLIIEKRLFHHEPKFQGKPDLICTFEEKLSIIDWRSSQDLKKRQWIEEKVIQAGAYSIMAETLGLRIEQLVVVVISPKKAQVFTESSVEDYQQIFLERLKQYQEVLKSS